MSINFYRSIAIIIERYKYCVNSRDYSIKVINSTKYFYLIVKSFKYLQSEKQKLIS
jgi:hypothetical protein